MVKRFFFLLNAAFAMAILDLISQVHLPSFVNMLPKYFKRSTFCSCFWSIIIVTGDGCFEILITFVFSTSFSCHSFFQFQSVYQSCPVEQFLWRNSGPSNSNQSTAIWKRVHNIGFRKGATQWWPRFKVLQLNTLQAVEDLYCLDMRSNRQVKQAETYVDDMITTELILQHPRCVSVYETDTTDCTQHDRRLGHTLVEDNKCALGMRHKLTQGNSNSGYIKKTTPHQHTELHSATWWTQPVTIYKLLQ